MKEASSPAYNRILLVGPCASGKSYLYESFPEEWRGIKYTTRAARPGEKHTKNYYFVNEYTFQEMEKVNLFKVIEEFTINKCPRVWKHGITVMEWYRKRVFILPPRAIEQMAREIPEEMKKCFVVYLDIPKRTRKERLSRIYGANAEEIERRLDDDLVEFAGFSQWNYRVSHSTFDRECLADKLLTKIK